MKTRAELERNRYKNDPAYRATRQQKNKEWRINGRNTEGVMARRKYYTIKMNAKTRGIELSVNAAYLRKVLISQGSKCAVTGAKLEYQGPTCHPHAPSVDRIDRAKGYVEGNIRWVTLQVNCAIGVGTMGQFLDMCRAAIRHAKRG